MIPITVPYYISYYQTKQAFVGNISLIFKNDGSEGFLFQKIGKYHSILIAKMNANLRSPIKILAALALVPTRNERLFN